MKIPRCLSKFFGHIYLHKYPCFVIWKPAMHKVKGKEVRQIVDCLQPGDFLLRRMSGWLSTFCIPGFWSHLGIYVGGGKVIHAVGAGVIEEDILDFCRTDAVAVLRAQPEFKGSDFGTVIVTHAYEWKAKSDAGETGYDYEFEDDDNEVYCTELGNKCGEGIFDDCYAIKAGVRFLEPDKCYKGKNINLIIDIRHE